MCRKKLQASCLSISSRGEATPRCGLPGLTWLSLSLQALALLKSKVRIGLQGLQQLTPCH